MKRKASNGSARRWALPRVPVTVRLPKGVVKRIDQELDQRDIPLSRNNWFLEAAIEKLQKSGSGESHGAK
jgi:hypothetical protein